MLRVITANVNGIRSAAKKGFFSWLSKQNADVICLQETRCQESLRTDPQFFPQHYHTYFFDAEKKGYSGVALYTKTKPTAIHQGLGWGIADTEGRYLQADFGPLSVASLYLPSGTSGEGRQDVKYEFMQKYDERLAAHKNDGRQYILCGDWNIAHKEIDIKNWRTNQKTSGFLPEERAWLDKVLGPLEFIDAFRALNKESEQYTWWSQRSRAREKNVGWRIDYQIVSQNIGDTIRAASIYKDEFFSDHAPLIVDYDLNIA